MEKKPTSEHAVFTFGRFNPPTTGHKKLVDKVVSHAWKHKADNYIFASHSHDAKKNPLGHREKTHFLKKFFPHAHIHDGEGIKTALDAVKHLHKKGYKKVTMMVGDDRQQEFHNLLHKYNHKDYDIPHLEVKSAGQRDPDSEGVEGMSASKMRDHAQKRNFKEFQKGVPNPAHAKELYHAVRKGMKLENFQQHFKALFLVGGPGSGKDFIISSLLDEANLVELPLEKLVAAVIKKENISELTNYPSLIVNGNADNLDKIMVSKKVLESMGYDTAMIYVYTSNEESKFRNDERISRGVKTFSEEVRHSKYTCSTKNMHHCMSVFEQFNIFDNSNDFALVGAVKKQEILGWLTELGESINSFYTTITKNEQAQIWLMESDAGASGSVMDKNGGTDGVMAKDYKKPNPYMFSKGSGKKPAKKPKEKSMSPPPDFFDQRMGAVPSGGVGITMSSFDTSQLSGTIIREKSFEKLRKNMSALTNNSDKE
jgi:hypothetical protein